jgi:3-methyladenine DNA glycosylase/8-oxoguanine DNA glycosylase
MASARDPRTIASVLAAIDPTLSALIRIVGPPPRRRAIPVADRFEQLATAILHQQLAGAAAATITRRSLQALDGTLSATALLAAPEGLLRSCGVSSAKERSLLDLATCVAEGRLELAALGRCSDEAVVEALSKVRGIGRWTAEMFLMGPMGRQDVWPVGDLGVRSGYSLISGRQVVLASKELEALGEPYRPYRSSVAWYCWQAVALARAHGGQLPR